MREIGTFYKKRILRLLLPFYIYAFFHILLTHLFPSLFSGIGIHYPIDIISLLLLGRTIDLSWITLLFIELSLLFPLLAYINKYKYGLWGYALFATISTIILSFSKVPYLLSFYIMWIPWSLGIVFSYMLVHKKKWQWYILLTSIFTVLFLLSFSLWQLQMYPLSLRDNKYPPNIYFMAYSFMITSWVVLLSKLAFWEKSFLRTLITWVSKQSYTFFLVHFIVLDFFHTLYPNLSATFLALLVMTVSLASCYCIQMGGDYLIIKNQKRRDKIIR